MLSVYIKFVCVCVQLVDEGKLQEVDNLYTEFESPEKANKM